MGEGGLKCSFNFSAKVLEYSPIALYCTMRFIIVLTPLKWTWMHIYQKSYETFAKSLGIGYYHMDVSMVDIVATEAVLGLCIAMFVVAFGPKSIKDPFKVPAP